MTTYAGGTQVKKGYYFNLQQWSLHPVARDGEQLPGAAAEVYWHLPLLAVVVLAPVMGAAFLMFLPFIGFYLVAQALAGRVARLFGRSATEIAATMTPGWQPGEAHLTGKRADAEEAGAKGAAEQDELSELEAEIAKRREQR